PIERMRDLPRVVAETAVGTAVPVRVLRDGAEVKLTITLGRLEVGEALVAEAADASEGPVPEDEVAEESEVVGPAPGLSDLVGIEIAPLDDASRSDLALGSEVSGVVVTAVREGSDALEKGMLPGQVIVEVNQREVATV